MEHQNNMSHGKFLVLLFPNWECFLLIFCFVKNWNKLLGNCHLCESLQNPNQLFPVILLRKISQIQSKVTLMKILVTYILFSIFCKTVFSEESFKGILISRCLGFLICDIILEGMYIREHEFMSYLIYRDTVHKTSQNTFFLVTLLRAGVFYP